MLRNCVCLVLAHMLDATPVMGWGWCWMLRNCVCLVLAHMLDATQLCLRTRSLKPMCGALRGITFKPNLLEALANLAEMANNRAAWRRKTLLRIEVSIWKPLDNGNRKTRTQTLANNGILGWEPSHTWNWFVHPSSFFSCCHKSEWLNHSG